MNNKYSLSYISFKKANIGNPLPAQSKVLRDRFKVYETIDEEQVQVANPTLAQIIHSINPNILTDSIRKYQGEEYVIVPVPLSSKRVEVDGKKSSEVEEINELARLEALYESQGVSDELPLPRTTIFNQIELEAFNWDQPDEL